MVDHHADLAAVAGDSAAPLSVGKREGEGGELAGALLQALGKGGSTGSHGWLTSDSRVASSLAPFAPI